MSARWLFPLTSLVGAFLLFVLQPLMAKQVLPWFGGATAVWSSCLVFFQGALVGGYAYAHLLKPLGHAWQVRVHGLLLVLAATTLPVTVSSVWQPTESTAPIGRLLLILLATVGLPYALLSATAPLLQELLRRTRSGARPYRLYASSNAGSLGALLAYPTLIEPYLPISAQAWIWSMGFVVFVALCGLCGYRAMRDDAGAVPSARPAAPRGLAADGVTALLWGALSACGSALLLAVTNRMCQDVAAVPLLWIVPLSLYLTTFIVAFAGWYRRRLWVVVFSVSAAASLWLFVVGPDVRIAMQVLTLSVLLLAGCMICHGELVTLAPPPERLTTFYLVVSVGGALGGMFVALAVPLIFTGYAELPLFTLLTPALLLVVIAREWLDRNRAPLPPRFVAAPVALGAVALAAAMSASHGPRGTIAADRGFHGVLYVVDDPPNVTMPMRRLYHGRILHGSQWLDPEARRQPTAYYGNGSGIHLAIDRHPNRLANRPMEIGVIGLGVGATAGWGTSADRMTFYELDRRVVDLAHRYFTFLADSPAAIDVVIGDGRLSLERELAAGTSRERFDVLAIDAFSGDSVPVHLLTREAFSLYRRVLKPDGVLAIHISNLHLDLAPVVRGLAAAVDRDSLLINRPADDLIGASDWMLVTAGGAFARDVARFSTPAAQVQTVMWTDGFSSLLSVLR